MQDSASHARFASWRGPALYAASAALLLACSSDPASAPSAAGGTNGAGGTAGAPGTMTACSGSEVALPKRLVRLTFNQQARTIASLFGPELGASIEQSFEILRPTQRTFPPLASPREGAVITDSQWQTSDNIAQAVAKHVFDNFGAVTGCAEPASLECAQSYVLGLAEKAFRKPLSEPEKARLSAVVSDVQQAGGSPQEAARYGVYAILEAPQYLYRTELGAGAQVEGPLAASELADAIAYFLTDGPPDAGLQTAAQSGALTTPEGLDAEVTRLLANDAVKSNLEAAMFAYFNLAELDRVVIDPGKFPEFTPELRSAMSREAELFLKSTLWSGPLGALLTSRSSRINASLASIYGLTFPPPDVTPEADGFAGVMLPDTRAGLLTLPGFLTARSRPDHPSVVGRGLAVNAALLCVKNPPFPEALSAQIAQANASLASASEREKATYRITTAPCSGCHSGFDPYGLSLENFDSLGRYRTTDDAGRPIDASVTLPAQAGGALVANATEMGAALASNDAFIGCMTKNLLSYALAEGVVDTDSCSTRAVVDKLRQTDLGFGALVREIIRAKAFSVRSAGGQP
jgi:hypothetical protein